MDICLEISTKISGQNIILVMQMKQVGNGKDDTFAIHGTAHHPEHYCENKMLIESNLSRSCLKSFKPLRQLQHGINIHSV